MIDTDLGGSVQHARSLGKPSSTRRTLPARISDGFFYARDIARIGNVLETRHLRMILEAVRRLHPTPLNTPSQTCCQLRSGGHPLLRLVGTIRGQWLGRVQERVTVTRHGCTEESKPCLLMRPYFGTVFRKQLP